MSQPPSDAATAAHDSTTTAGGVLIDASTGHGEQRTDSSRRADILVAARNECQHPSATRIRRNVAGHPDWSDATLADVACRFIHIGVSSDVVLAAWGRPETINSTSTAFSESEQWVYGSGSYVYLEGGIVTSIQQSR